MEYKSNHHVSAWRLPAEWEPQWGVQLTWPHAKTDWAPMLEEITATYEEMAREISKREELLTVRERSDDTWARDHGFISLVDDLGHRRLLDFCFNGWGEKFPASQDNALNRLLYDQGAIDGEYVDCLDFVLEGGSIESDGRGTVFTTTGCLLAPHRNQPLTKAEIEARLKKELYAERILWIDHGNLTGDDTDGHIDTLVRICPDDTLLYVGCDDPADEQYDELKLMEEQLHSFRTLEDKPYKLVKLPMPRAIYDEDYRLPATYANFLVVNGAVLCPTYSQPDLDAEALRLIGKAFPDRELLHHAISKDMKVGFLQQANSADLHQNILRLSEGISDLAKRGAELIVLQELHNSLYFCQVEDVNNFDLAEPIPGPSTKLYGELAKQFGVVIVTSLFERRAAGLYHNTAVVLEKDGSIAGIYRKMHIPDDPAYYEKFYFTPGDLGFHPIQTSVGRLGVMVCWDQWYPEAARLMALQGAEILIYPTAIGYAANDTPEEQQRQRRAWQTVMRGHAVANGLPVLAVNRVGFEPDPSGQTEGIQFWGTSFLAGPQGEIIYESDGNEEESIIIELDLQHSEDVRRWWPFLRDRRIDAYGDILQLNIKHWQTSNKP